MKRLIPLALFVALSLSRAQAPSTPTVTAYYEIDSPTDSKWANANPKPVYTPKLTIYVIAQNILPNTSYPVIWVATSNTGRTYSSPSSNLVSATSTGYARIDGIPLDPADTSIRDISVQVWTTNITVAPSQVGQ